MMRSEGGMVGLSHLRPDWAWGVDVRTGLVAVGAVSSDGEVLAWSVDTGLVGRQQGAQRLAGVRELLIARLGLVEDEFRPGAVVVENPLIVRPDFRLLTLVGVVMESFFAVLRCPVLELTSGEWKAEVCGHGHASKPVVLERARQIGYRGDLQDEADAVCMAVSALALLKGARIV